MFGWLRRAMMRAWMNVASAVAGYAARYRQPGERADRVAIEIAVDKVMGRV